MSTIKLCNNVYKINNIFTSEELTLINNSIKCSKIPVDNNGNYINIDDSYQEIGIDHRLGRLQFGLLNNFHDVLENIFLKINDFVNIIFTKNYIFSHAMVVEYNNKYGTPNLPPHYDADSHHMIVNYQLSSNTSWSIGLNTNHFRLEDNSAIAFNGNENIHWRPHKVFKDNEYVTMIFFRFIDKSNNSNYSHLNYWPDDKIFNEINHYRNSLKF